MPRDSNKQFKPEDWKFVSGDVVIELTKEDIDAMADVLLRRLIDQAINDVRGKNVAR